MKQAKKIFTRMCLNNWGGITHKVLEFNEYVNLFSGKSGSGKSTVMDAIQVILYGSFSSSFLNKAADDAKNRRNVFGYLRGEQKDGSANRAGQDFCSNIVLEILDTGSGEKTCVGMAFEVRKHDTEIKKYVYFSHCGSMPVPEYLTMDGYPYTNQEIRALVEERQRSAHGRLGVEANRIYPSKEAYLNTLYDGILGYIDGTRFMTMEKSAIALKMSNGTGQFIRDYMFPKNTGDTIEKISEQLGAYRDIKEKIEDTRKRIELLTDVKEKNAALYRTKEAMAKTQALIRYIDVAECQSRIEAAKEDQEKIRQDLAQLEEQKNRLFAEWDGLEQELIRVSADLKSSDLGQKESQLHELEKQYAMLASDERQWQKVLSGLKRWEEDSFVSDYVSNPLLQRIGQFTEGEVTEEQCMQLRDRIESERENIEAELEDLLDENRTTKKELEEVRGLVEDMKNDRKPYPDMVKKARAALERRLSDIYGHTVKVAVFADLFDVREEEWKNAIEGRLGRLKLALVTEPRYAEDAAKVFREMKQFEEVELIHTKAVGDGNVRVEENTLYEAVDTDFPYVDTCLKHYLGRIKKCRSIEELQQVRDGVTPDCYSYSNYIFRHLRKRDYTRNACIGSRVSKAKLAEYEEELTKLMIRYQEQEEMIRGLRAVRELESLGNEDAYYVRLSRAGKELEELSEQKKELSDGIELLRKGQYLALEQQKKQLEAQMKEKKEEQLTLENQRMEQTARLSREEANIANYNAQLKELLTGYVANAAMETEAQELLKQSSGQSVKNSRKRQVEKLSEEEEKQTEALQQSRNSFNQKYPSLGFHGMEKSNACYEELLLKYQRDYESTYLKEFEKQCAFIYKSLRENVIATIHGDINAAKRHTASINRLLRKTNFSDSTYQIRIEPAENENGQFYEMLTAPELDSKNLSNDGYEGQISFGEDDFYQKYEAEIRLLTDKFMPLRDADDRQREQKQKEMEQYADYRNYLSFRMYEQVTDEAGNVIRENSVDEMAGRDSGGEGQNPKYVALLAGFAMLYMQQSNRDSKIKLVLLDEAFSKMDQERSAVCLKYARQMELQMIVCVPDERLQSLIRNVDCVYGFRRHKNQISMMHIDKGNYLKLMEGSETEAEKIS